jgi:hypothetical protein
MAEQAPEGYSADDLARLKDNMLQDDEGSAFYSAFQFSQYAPKTGLVGDEDDDEEEDIDPEAPAPLTDIPTSSTKASRPRTVAAGYDPDRKVLTVMFRDGTLWNYYNVEPGTASTFKSAISKGPMINWYRNGVYSPGELLMGQHSNGPADTSNVSSAVQADIYRIARTSQYRYAFHGRVPRTAQGRASVQSATRTTKANGRNNASAGKAHKPHKP